MLSFLSPLPPALRCKVNIELYPSLVSVRSVMEAFFHSLNVASFRRRHGPQRRRVLMVARSTTGCFRLPSLTAFVGWKDEATTERWQNGSSLTSGQFYPCYKLIDQTDPVKVSPGGTQAWRGADFQHCQHVSEKLLKCATNVCQFAVQLAKQSEMKFRQKRYMKYL